MNIIEMCNNIHFDTKKRIFGLYNVLFEVFRFNITKRKTSVIERVVKNIFINIYNNDVNLRVFSCLSYQLYMEEYFKPKGFLNHIHRLTERLSNELYEIYVEFIQYRSFDVINETQNSYNIFNVNIA
jgi:hypothetical protein